MTIFSAGPMTREHKNRPVRSHGAEGDHLDRRLESADAASVLVDLLVLPLLSAFDALDATFRLVLTEFFAINSPPLWRALAPGQR